MRLLCFARADGLFQPLVVRLLGEPQHPARHRDRHPNPNGGTGRGHLTDERVDHFWGQDMRLRQIRRRAPKHLVLHLQLPDPSQHRRHLAALVGISRWCHPVRAKTVISHPRLQRGLRDAEVSAHLLLRRARSDHRHSVPRELIGIDLRHDCHPSSTTPPRESCSHELNRTFSRPSPTTEPTSPSPTPRPGYACRPTSTRRTNAASDPRSTTTTSKGACTAPAEQSS